MSQNSVRFSVIQPIQPMASTRSKHRQSWTKRHTRDGRCVAKQSSRQLNALHTVTVLGSNPFSNIENIRLGWATSQTSPYPLRRFRVSGQRVT